MEALMPRMTLPGFIPGMVGDSEIRAEMSEMQRLLARSNINYDCRFVLPNKINKAKCNEALVFHHHDVATY